MIKGDLIKEEEWKRYFGCVCWFSHEGNLFIFEAGKAAKLEHSNLIGYEHMLVRVEEEYVFITKDGTFTTRVEKKNVRVFPIPEEKEEPEDDPYRHLRALKAIGFPQYGRGRTYMRNIGTPDEFKVYDPTIGQLFEYLGNIAVTLMPLEDGTWDACGKLHASIGSTRKIALINLVIKIAEYEKKQKSDTCNRGDCYVPRTHRRDLE